MSRTGITALVALIVGSGLAPQVAHAAGELRAVLPPALPADETEASAGDPDPLLAAEDSLREFAADEIFVVTRPDGTAAFGDVG